MLSVFVLKGTCWIEWRNFSLIFLNFYICLCNCSVCLSLYFVQSFYIYNSWGASFLVTVKDAHGLICALDLPIIVDFWNRNCFNL